MSGYSIKTVSRAIHNHPDINEDTRKSIMEIVDKYSFSPNWAAQSLRSNRTHTIGYVIPNLTNNFYGLIGMAIDSFFREKNYNTLICFTSKSHEHELESLRSLLNKNVDGIIIAPIGSFDDYFNALPNLKKKPLVIIDNKFKNLNVNYVLHDNIHGAKILTEYLIEYGHKGIGFIGGPLEDSSGYERYAGYKKALKENGMKVDDTYVRITDWEEINEGYSATLDLIQSKEEKLSALFYANSQLLLGGYKAIHEIKLNIPNNLSIVSFDRPFTIDALIPHPTTLGAMEKKIALSAAKLLYEGIKKKNTNKPKEIRVKSNICEGESCCRR